VDSSIVVKLAYLVSAGLFIFGLKGMSHPRTAIRGNLLGASGMGLAIVATLFDPSVARFDYIAAGAVVGAAVGGVMAVRVQMTAMPQMVGLLNGFGGGASVLVAGADLLNPTTASSADVLVATALSGVIGGVTFWGSLVAYGKLDELPWFKKPFTFPGQQAVNAILGVVLVGLTVALVYAGSSTWHGPALYVLVALVASVLGVLLVSPIGGADMPVVVALLNSYSGLAAAATGFVIDNNVLIITGSFVGASGVILTQIMCKAMNRSLFNVFFGVASDGGGAADDGDIYANVRSTSPEEVAMVLETAQRVVFVPGYGLAVAQAQHAVRDLATVLEGRGATVEYAIHPVAGRMPGHMNVLLAEADVPYEQLKEMDDINPTFSQVDVAIVIGANDVVNPAARTDPKSPIAGMPILDVDKARTVVVIKRSLSPGFAGIPNPLFAAANTVMLFADGKKAVLDIVAAMKNSA
jgi:NAD(P) transhydrogenase subunit beta